MSKSKSIIARGKQVFQNSILYGALLVSLTFIVMIILPSVSQLSSSVYLRNSGKILAYFIFDECDVVGDWVASSSCIISVDANDKIYGNGSLIGTFASSGPSWGGIFYKRPNGTAWDFSNTPLMKIWMKIENSIPTEFHFEIVTGASWDIFSYEIHNQLTVGNWTEISIDLRLPDKSPESKLPELTHINQIAFVCWTYIDKPVSFHFDRITLEHGQIIPLKAVINPKFTGIIIGENVTFRVVALGGLGPYKFTWFINNTEQLNTSESLTFTTNQAGLYLLKCIISDARENVTVTAIVRVFQPSPEFPSSLDIFKSEVRGMFVQPGWYYINDWDLIAQTCKNWGINTIFLQISKYYIWDYEQNTVKYYPPLATAVNTFKKYGFNVHILLVIGYQDVPAHLRALTSDGYIDWIDFCKPRSKEMLVEIVSSLVQDYDIDGICYDYIRWDFRDDMPLSVEARDQFMAETGITDLKWPDDVLTGGRYYWNFTNWRHKPITEAVKQMSQAIRSINKNILISAAVLSARYGEDYMLWRVGQNVPEWVEEGYLDFLSPMMGAANITRDKLIEGVENSLDYYVGGSQGKIPFIPFIYVEYRDEVVTPEVFTQIVQILREHGVDDWIIWRYGGPGWGIERTDVRPYLTRLKEAGLMKEHIWAIQNFSIIIDQDKAIVSWSTTAPTKGRIEYANNSLFMTLERYSQYYKLYWKDVEYINGGVILEDEEFQFVHLFIIPITEQTQIRIHSLDESGVIVTSPVIVIKDFGT